MSAKSDFLIFLLFIAASLAVAILVGSPRKAWANETVIPHVNAPPGPRARIRENRSF